MITRKTFVKVAKTLALENATPAEINRWVEVFKTDNPRFKETRFRDYIKKVKETK
jgi:hypothetical protein